VIQNMQMQEHEERIEKLTYTVEEAAKALNIGRNNMLKMLRLPKFEGIAVKVGRKWLISKKRLDEWVYDGFPLN
jgi:excisionase family DNA binding protein